MGVAIFPAAGGGKTQFRTMLTSGTSYTVPAGVSYLNVTLVGGGGGGSTSQSLGPVGDGQPGQTSFSTLSATAGATITYAIGAGGAAGTRYTNGSAGGTTTFTGATSATGGAGGIIIDGNMVGNTGNRALFQNQGKGGAANPSDGGVGGAGFIIVEYWA